MRPIFPSKMSGEEGWCLNMAIRLSAIDGNGCLGGGVRECSLVAAVVVVALEADEDEEDEATFRREALSSSGGGGIGGSCNEKMTSCRSR